MTRYTAAVIGLGNIGQGYDYDHPGLVLTHARAFARHPGFELLAGVDPDANQRERFEQQYRLPAYPDCAALLAAASPAVMAVAAPTAVHAATLEQVLAFRPRAVLCEKPLAQTLADAQRMLAAAAAARCALAVNYVRRFDPGVRELKQAIDAGQYGEIYKGVAWYSKGLRHNGTHLVDLLRYLLGEADGYALLERGRKWQQMDPEPDFRIRFGATGVYFFAAREECFSHFRIELVATGGRLVYAEGGSDIHAKRVHDDPVFSGYRQLEPKSHRFAADTGRYQWHVLESLHQHLDSGTTLASDGASALATQALVENIVNLCEPA